MKLNQNYFKMKIKSFKTKANNGTICRVDVVLLESNSVNEEQAVIIQTTRAVPRSDFEAYNRLNDKFPMYYAIKETENYAILVTRSAPIKLSTFLKINETVNELIKP